LLQLGGEGALVVADRVPADAPELAECARHGECADHVRGAGLLPVRRLGPDHLVEVDEVDRATTGEERLARLERRAGPMSAPAP